MKRITMSATFALIDRWRRLRLALAALLLACAWPALAQRALTVAVASSPLSLPLYVADSEGYFADEGLKLNWVECTGGFRCMQLMFGGQADLATASDVPVMFNSFERSDYAVIGTFATVSDELKVVARRSAGITSAQQLAGKRIGAVLRSSSHYFLDAFLLINGIDPTSVTLVALRPEEMVDSLTTGKVDAVSAWEPIGYQAKARLADDAVVLPNAAVYNETFNLIASRRVFGTHDAELVKVLRAVERATRFIRTQPAQAQAILRNRLKVDQGLVDWVWPGLQFRLSLDQALLRTLEAEARWAMRGGQVDARKAPKFRSFVHTAPLRAANEAAVSLTER